MDEIAATQIVPFVGLRPFDTGDAAWFCGRDREIAALTLQLRASRFTAVVGPSGSGKSSLVRAGVMPELEADGWLSMIAKPGSAPLRRLARALAAAAPEDRLGETRRNRFENMLRASAFGLSEIAQILKPTAPNLLLVIDQFEELFRYGDEATGAAKAGMREEARAFIELLLTATGSGDAGVHVCVTMRSDFFGNCSAYPGLALAVSGSQFLVPLPGRAQLEEVIRKPVAQACACVEEELVQRLLVDVEEEVDQLPLLQHTLRRLWDSAGTSRVLRSEDYVQVGRISGSIDHQAETVRNRLTKAGPIEAAILERVMKALTELNDHDLATRRPQVRGALLALVDPAITANSEAAKVSLDRVLAALSSEETSFLQIGEDSDPEVDIGHEALIRGWKRLSGDAGNFASGWLREERDDGERWRGYVRRAQEGPLLWFRECLRLSNWQRRGYLGKAWSARYGDRWADVIRLKRRSLQRSLGVSGLVVILFLIVGMWGHSMLRERQHALEEALRNSRLGSLSLAAQAHEAVQAGNARLAALLARAALLEAPNSDDPHYVAAAEAVLADALRHPIEYMRLLHSNGVNSAAFSADGTRIVSASNDATVRQWDAATGQPIGKPLVGHESGVLSAAFSPDGTRIVSASMDKTLRLWDAATGKPIGMPLEGHGDAVTSAAFSPDGTRIVSTSIDKTLRLWDAATGQPIGEALIGHGDAVLSAAFSPDGTRIVSASMDRTLRLWDAATGKPLRGPLIGHDGGVESVAFSPDGTRIVSASDDMTLRLWNATTGQPIGGPLMGHSANVNSAVFSPDGQRVVSASRDKTVRLWNAATGKPLGEPFTGHTDAVETVAFAPNGKDIVSASDDKTIRIWDTSTDLPIADLLIGHDSGVRSAAFSPDGTRIVSTSTDKTLRLWDAATGKPIGEPLTGHESGVLGAVFSPDGTRIVSTSWDKTLRLWDGATGKPLGAPLTGHTDVIIEVAFSPDSQKILSASWDKTLRLWDAATGQPIGAPLVGHAAHVTSAAFSPDGKSIVSASGDHTVRRWDAATGQPIGEPLIGHEDDVRSAAFSPDGRRIVSTSWDKTLRLWDAATGKPIGKPLEGHGDAVLSAAFSHDGTRIVSRSLDRTLRLWDAATGQPIGEPLTGHTATIVSAAFSPDDRLIVSVSADKTLRLWNAATGQPIGEPLTGHTDAVNSAAFSPDGKSIVSASEDRTLRQWPTGWAYRPQAHRPLADLIADCDRLCQLDEDERKANGLFDPRFPPHDRAQTTDQQPSCGHSLAKTAE
jgi:WD40 repeat protein